VQLTFGKGGRLCSLSPASVEALPWSQLPLLPNSAGFTEKWFPECQFSTVGPCSL